LHELQQAVALHERAQHGGFGVVKARVPLGERAIEGGVVPGFPLATSVTSGMALRSMKAFL